jgi:hypothetical protein
MTTGSAHGMAIGKLILFGSGESQSLGGQIIRQLAEQYGQGVVVALLETPAGFQPNSQRVLDEVADLFESRIRYLHPVFHRIPARNRETEFSPDREEIVRPIAQADIIFMGAGSPTYAVRQLKGSLAWQYAIGAWQRGATLVLASAAAIAAGAYALPVYEIFKAGEELGWREGLDLLKPFGASLAILPHWNNSDGGTDLDTSRCFMGEERFAMLRGMLPEAAFLFGIDENTVAEIDIEAKMCRVAGSGNLTLRGPRVEKTIASGETINFSVCAGWSSPAIPFGIPEEIWRKVQKEKEDTADEVVPDGLNQLLHERDLARLRSDFARADELRRQIETEGWEVTDTKEGARLRRRPG